MRTYPRPLHALLLLAFALTLTAAPTSPAGAPLAMAAAAADQAAATDRLIVTLRPAGGAGTQAVVRPGAVAAQLSAEAGEALTYVRQLDDGVHLLALAAARPYAEVAALADRLAAAPEVLAAEPDTLVFPALEPADSGYRQYAWHLKGAGGGSYGANLPAAWDITTGAPGIVTAVIDTGATLGHEDLAGRTPAGNPGYDMIGELAKANDGDGRDPDPSDPGDYVTAAEAVPGCAAHDSTWHGTHVAGTIGARANNGKGMAGINWESPLLHIRALGKCGGYISDIADGLRWAAGLPVGGLPLNPNPARVFNLSLGGSGACSAYFQSAVDDARELGGVVVVAAGNENRSASNATPGNCSGVITIAATSQEGFRASYSNYGAAIEIAAPGGDSAVDSMVYSTLNSGSFGPVGDSYAFYQGTSMATPHVAGIVSLMLSVNPNLASDEVLSIIQSTATAFPAASDCIGACGAGIINAGAAVEEAARRVRQAGFLADGSAAAEGSAALSIPLSLSIASNQTVSVPYTITGSAGAGDYTLAAGSVSFAPGATTASLSVSIADDDLVENDETVVINLAPGARTGLGAMSTHTVTIKDNDARPIITVTPAALSFGAQRVGTTGAPQAVTVRNAGELPLTVSSLSFSGSFSRAGGTCPAAPPFTLAKGGSCTVSVQFAPARVGARGGNLAVGSNAGDPYHVALSGVGVIPALGYGPTTLSFADQLVGGAGATGTITLTNPGTAPLTISALTASDDYSVGATSCAAALPATLAAGASCTVQVGFSPSAGGDRPGLLTVVSDVPGGPYAVGLAGAGLAPQLSLDVTGLDFGGQAQGTSTVSRTVTVANRGGAPLSLTDIGVSGASFGRAGGSCPTSFPATLAASATCTVQVSFSPAAAQSYSGALSITSAAPGGPASVSLAGVGTAGPAASPLLSPAALTFADRVLPAATGARTVVISNQGDALMTVSAIVVAGAGFSQSGGDCGPPPVALGPGASCTVEVSMTAAGTGAYSGTLTVLSDAPGGPQVAPLSGAVVADAGLFDLEVDPLATTAATVTLRFTVSRAAPLEGAASIGYSVTADREAADGDLVVARGTATFGAGEDSRLVVVTLDRLALYGAGFLVIDLDEPAGRSGFSPAASRSVALPADEYTSYLPLIAR